MVEVPTYRQFVSAVGINHPRMIARVTMVTSSKINSMQAREIVLSRLRRPKKTD